MKNISTTTISILLITFFLFVCPKVTAQLKLTPVMIGDKYGYIDRKGTVVIKPRFSSACIFSEGLAMVQSSGTNPSCGFINEQGAYVIAPIYRDATSFSEGIAWVCLKGGSPQAINKKGETVFAMNSAESVNNFSEGLAAYVRVDSGAPKWGYIDKTGKTIIAPVFSSATDFVYGMAAAQAGDGKWGCIDRAGNWLLSPKYESARPCPGGKVIVVTERKFGIADQQGHFLILPQYDNLELDGSNYSFEQDGKVGVLDSNGKILIEPEFTQMMLFGDNKLTAASKDAKYGFIDRTGKFVIPPAFAFAVGFDGNLAAVWQGNKLAFIDTKGKPAFPAKFDGPSKDYLEYFVTHRSSKDEIECDTTNVNMLVYNMRTTILGLDPSATVSNLMQQLNAKESDFYNEGSICAVKSVEYNSDIKVIYGIMGNPVTDGVFDPDFVPGACVVSYKLAGKAADKVDEVLALLKDQCAKEYQGVQNGPSYSFKNKKNTIYINRADDVILLITEQTRLKN